MTDGWIDKTLSALSIEQRIGQLLAPRAFSHYVPRDSDAFKHLLRLTTEIGVGGFVLFQGQVMGQAQLVTELQDVADVPLLFGQDAEWGVGMRLDDATSFPSMAAIAATRNTDHAYNLGSVTAAEARALGVHHVYAPVVDINSNPANPIINVRSFGEDAELVAEMGAAVVRGLNDGGVLSTAKHFPGHGDTSVDSHADLPVLPFDIDRLEALEWIPFVSAIEAGVSSVMVGHLAMPAIDGADAGPASLSKRVVTGLLRERLGFDGLITTDAMDMQGVRKRYGAGEAAVRAVEAGVDIVMVSPDDYEAYAALSEAVETGRLSADRIASSARRVLSAKASLGLPTARYAGTGIVRKTVGCHDHFLAARRAADAAVTLLKNDDVVPLPPEASVLIVTLNDTKERGRTKTFVGSMKKSRTGATQSIELGRNVFAEEVGRVLEAAELADIVVLNLVVAVRSFSGQIGVPVQHVELIRSLTRGKQKSKTVLVSLGSPYVAAEFAFDMDAVVLGYGHAECMQQACAAVLIGSQSSPGRLPITLSDEFPIGAGGA